MDIENQVITLMNPASPFAEAYKKLQVNIQIASMNKNVQVIQITSTQASEGKTDTAINLAAVYALKNKKVIVVDLDFRKPKVHKIFKLHNDNGLVDILAGNSTLEDVLYHHESGIDVLIRGSKPLKIEAILESEKMAEFINSLRNKYDIIILDCPPTVAVTDASLITKLADGLVFVVAYNQAKKDVVKESIKRLKSTGVNVLGVVMSQMEKSMSSTYYYGYKYYSDSSDKGGKE